MSIRQLMVLVVSSGIFLLLGLVYALNCEKVFETQSEIVLLRSIVENPEHISPDIRNRWVWVKDGSNILSIFYSEKVIKKLLTSLPFVENQEVLRKMIHLKFTGGDDGKFIINIRGRDKDKLVEMERESISILKEIYQEYFVKIYDKYLLALNSLSNDKKHRYNRGILKSAITKLKINQTLKEVEYKERLVVTKISGDLKTVWPKTPFILLISLIVGALLPLLFLRIREIVR